MSFIDGVHHLITFEANLLLLSRSLSWNKCLRLRLLVFHFHASRITSFTLLDYVLHASQHSSRFIFRKRSGDEGIWTLDPWSGNLQRWPLDHATPPNWSCFSFLFIRSFGFGPSSFKKPIVYHFVLHFDVLALSPSRNIIHLFLLTIFTKELTYGISTGKKNITLLIKTITAKKLQRGIHRRFSRRCRVGLNYIANLSK